MGDTSVHITLTIETEQPIEIGDFVGAFTSIAEEYTRHIRDTQPGLEDEAKIYVKEVRAGSIIAHLIPGFVVLAPFIADMESVLIVEQFVRTWGSRLTSLFSGNGIGQPQTKSELETFADATAAIANDPNGSAKLEAAYFEDGERKIKAAFKFSTPDARRARTTIRDKLQRLESRAHDVRERVLMVFTRPDSGDAQVGKASGERVLIEEVSPRKLALIYSSEMAEGAIKQAIREADHNIFKLGFVVDVHVTTRDGKPVGYGVTNLHQVVDLPDDESDEGP